MRYNVSTPAGCSANCHSHKAGILGLPREAHGGGQPSAPEKSLTKNRRTDSLCTTTHRELKHPVMFSFPLFEVLGFNKHPLVCLANVHSCMLPPLWYVVGDKTCSKMRKNFFALISGSRRFSTILFQQGQPT